MTDRTTITPKGWAEKTLAESVEIIDGDRGVNYPQHNDFSNSGHCVFLNTKNIPGTKFNFSETSFINKRKDEKLRKGRLKRGDFVLTTRGTIGNYAYFSSSVPYENVRINSGMVILRPKEKVLDQDFFYAYLASYFFYAQVKTLSSGTAQPQLPIKDLSVFKILLPPLPEQRMIAAVLSSLDDKIELLHEQNKTLETIAKVIFREWFVNFNFPWQDGKPYKSNGGKMVISELGEIPDGWKVGRLIEGNISEFVKTGLEEFDGEKDYVETSNVTLSNFVGDFENVTYQKRPSRANMRPVENSFWFARMAESRKYLLFQPTDDKDIQAKILSTGFAGIRCVEDYLYFYWCFVLSNRFNNLKNQYAEGAVQVAINNSGIQRILLALPPKDVAQRFARIVSPFFERISSNNYQIQTLASIRKVLLPKLMKGEIRVSEVRN